MESGGEEDGGFSFGSLHLSQNQQPSSHFQPNPSLSAIDRFLWDQNNHFSHHETLSSVPNPRNLFPGVDESLDDLFASSVSGGISLPLSGDSSQSQEQSNIDHGNLSNVEPLDLSEQTRILAEFQESIDLTQKSARGVGRRLKHDSLKGQWTAQEDRKLKKLVNKYGDKKWAQISEKMAGRVGKQCRERWLNHLRPDIKKDPWSVEEEIKLINAHKKFENRWSEIAKGIHGRTENSIKNHWNATKRKLDSCNMGRRQQKHTRKKQPSILLDYISSYYANKSTSDPPPSTATATATSISFTTPPGGGSSSTTSLSPPLLLGFSEPSYEEDSQSVLTRHRSHEDEMSFMKSFFGADSSGSSSSGGGVGGGGGVHPQQALVFNQEQVAKPPGNAGDSYYYHNNFNPSNSFGFTQDHHHHHQIIPGIIKQEPISPNLLIPTQAASSEEEMSSQFIAPPPPGNPSGATYDSYLFDHNNGGSAGCCYYNMNSIEMLMNINKDNQGSSSSTGRREMDLIEMVSASQFSRGGSNDNSNNFFMI